MEQELQEIVAQTPVIFETVLSGYCLQLLVFANVTLGWKALRPCL